MKGSRVIPDGAVGLLQARLSKGPYYTVTNIHGTIEKRQVMPGKWFFPFTASLPKLGYCFLNYFHALAYSLKRKAANGSDPS